MPILKRTMTRAALISMMLCLSLLSATHIHLLAQSAQSNYPPTPLVVGILGDQYQGRYLEGDVWAWGGSEWIQRTGSGHTTWPIVSPSGGAFVYEQASPEYIKTSNASSANGNNRDNAGNEIRPENIYLWNFSTALATPVALQPWNASLEAGKTRYTL
ncbi:MAG TPA: hypothetical protein VKQ72_03755, partial [Aggregatilineales bacterium]|nr:hypothetical protein [Aggregatilineales bacterium]